MASSLISKTAAVSERRSVRPPKGPKLRSQHNDLLAFFRMTE